MKKTSCEIMRQNMLFSNDQGTKTLKLNHTTMS